MMECDCRVNMLIHSIFKLTTKKSMLCYTGYIWARRGIMKIIISSLILFMTIIFSFPVNAIVYRGNTYDPGAYVNPRYQNNDRIDNTLDNNWENQNNNNSDIRKDANERHSTDIFDSNW